MGFRPFDQLWDYRHSDIQGAHMSQEDFIIEQIAVGPMQNFAYLVGWRPTGDAVLVDPAWNVSKLLERVDELELNLQGALVTHYHPDHCGGSFASHQIEGIAELLAERPCHVYCHRLEADGLKKVTGISENDMRRVDSGDTLDVGDIEVEFLHTPGHTPGSQCFRIKHTLVAGDTLFIHGCGRVDLPGSNADDMFKSLRRLSELPDETVVLPGHHYSSQPSATLGFTKSQNPYLRIQELDMWRSLMGV